jgi:hypothetical protein
MSVLNIRMIFRLPEPQPEFIHYKKISGKTLKNQLFFENLEEIFFKNLKKKLFLKAFPDIFL